MLWSKMVLWKLEAELFLTGFFFNSSVVNNGREDLWGSLLNTCSQFTTPLSMRGWRGKSDGWCRRSIGAFLFSCAIEFSSSTCNVFVCCKCLSDTTTFSPAIILALLPSISYPVHVMKVSDGLIFYTTKLCSNHELILVLKHPSDIWVPEMRSVLYCEYIWKDLR